MSHHYRTVATSRRNVSSRLAVATSSCFVLPCSVGANFHFIPYRLTTHYNADSTLQVPPVIRSDIYPLTVCFAPVDVLTFT
jgi:hypothetical protein